MEDADSSAQGKDESLQACPRGSVSALCVGIADGPSTIGIADGPYSIGIADGPSTIGIADGPYSISIADGPSTARVRACRNSKMSAVARGFERRVAHAQRTISAPSRHRRRHVHCAGMGVPVLKTTTSAGHKLTASPRRSF